MIKTEHNEDITEHNNHIIDPLDSEAGIKNETVEEINYPDFDKEASTSTGSVMANWVFVKLFSNKKFNCFIGFF